MHRQTPGFPGSFFAIPRQMKPLSLGAVADATTTTRAKAFHRHQLFTHSHTPFLIRKGRGEDGARQQASTFLGYQSQFTHRVSDDFGVCGWLGAEEGKR